MKLIFPPDYEYIFQEFFFSETIIISSIYDY